MNDRISIFTFFQNPNFFRLKGINKIRLMGCNKDLRSSFFPFRMFTKFYC